MKKSNKVSVFYVVSCFVLFSALIFGGCYGIYLSVGLNFVRSSVSNITEGMNNGGAQNVSFGGSVNFPTSMVGVIILSIVLVVLSVFDFVSLIKQIIFFKQFRMIRNSKIEQKIEKKVKSKGSVIFFAILIDILSLVAGVAGIFINARSFTNGNFVWILYTIDALVALFSVISIVLLIIKLKQAKSIKEELGINFNCQQKNNTGDELEKTDSKFLDDSETIDINIIQDIDELENKLLKLKYLKSTKLISPEEYQRLREKFFKKEDVSEKIEK